MQWVCILNTTGRYCNWFTARVLGRIVPIRFGRWGGINIIRQLINTGIGTALLEDTFDTAVNLFRSYFADLFFHS
jgi:hypothetical protein